MSDTEDKSSCNLISNLPDDMLQSIVDKLPVADAVRTEFVSRDWRNLSKNISNIRFGPSWVRSTGKDIVSSLNHFIRLHQAQKIKKFSVEFSYQPEMSADVDSWVQFAIEKDVEELKLAFTLEEDEMETEDDSCYEIPPYVFNCESLIKLVLASCALRLPHSVCLRSLQEVVFYQIELDKNAIQTLTSGTPQLKHLYLINCNRTRDLYIHVASVPALFILTIIESFFIVNRKTKMVIDSPTFFHLEFKEHIPRSKYEIEYISDILEVQFELDGMFDVCGNGGQNILANDFKAQKYENILKELLSSFQAADTLSVSSWCIQLLSLRQLRNSWRLMLQCTTLGITTSFKKWELPGIIHILTGCNEIIHLVIETAFTDDEIKVPQDFMSMCDFQENEYLANQAYCLINQLDTLKTVIFVNTCGDYQTWESGNFEIHKFFNGSRSAIQLLLLLRIITMNMEHIVFATNKQKFVVCLSGKKNGPSSCF